MLLYARFDQPISYRVPLGIAYLGAILREKGINVVLREGGFYASWESFKEDLLKEKPDIVGLSASSFLIKKVLNYAKIIKEELPNTKVIIGGPLCSVIEDENFLKYTDIDFGVYGEGENTFLELVRAIESNKSLNDVKGIIYRKEGQTLRNPPREWLDLSQDKRPFPARDLLPIDKYLSTMPTFPIPYPATDIESSRGCYANCMYCQPVLRNMFGKRIRYREPKEVVDEIEMLIKKYKIKGLNLGNDEPLANRKWVLDFCDEIIKRKIKIKISVPCRVDLVNEDTFKRMKKAGFFHIGFGVESGSQQILDLLRKGVKVEQIKKAFKICEKLGLIARCNIMVGSPGETTETIQESINLIKEIKPDLIYLAATTPTPGSDLYDYSKEKGLLEFENLEDYTAFDAGYLKLEHLTTDQIYDSIQKISSVYKKQLLFYFLNPLTAWRKKHLLSAVFFYYLGLLKNPKQFFSSVIYGLTYGKHIKKKKKQN